MRLVVDGVLFDRVSQALFDGRLSIRGVTGLSIRNSVFTGVSSSQPSDGIFIAGSSRRVEIGPGNRFSGILQAMCGTVHCDAIQDYGGGPSNRIFQNVFENCDTFIMMPDGSTNVVVQNNLFNGLAVPYRDKIQFGSSTGLAFTHNTLLNVRASFDSKDGAAATMFAKITNNIMTSGSSIKTSGGTGCAHCDIHSILFDDRANAMGSDVVIGEPRFVGGLP
jgi:hypothetical protein